MTYSHEPWGTGDSLAELAYRRNKARDHWWAILEIALPKAETELNRLSNLMTELIKRQTYPVGPTPLPERKAR